MKHQKTASAHALLDAAWWDSQGRNVAALKYADLRQVPDVVPFKQRYERVIYCHREEFVAHRQ